LDVLIKHVRDEPISLTVQTGISHELNSVVMRALAKDPQARQGNAIVLLQELEKSVRQFDLQLQRRWWQVIVHQLGVLILFLA
jgi:hypothetical protein